ncbi:hypothetical protein RFI_06830 [Reticulomyxa filosa]|uniref:Uncharacterized protein n=1 Tax=Reticulomyxa filosa TaxID=46433 RepID=X6NVF5_RETFI|nr:hypothetical protein RFI_06830 [Reticulomyxa filosa]|eukprot:ETO30290.1 hypothetical protein RFI_06830 [Reticulomyxa filosa]
MDTEAIVDYSNDKMLENKMLSHRETGHIQFSEEYRFMLLRFWNLFDSIFYSPYVAAKLGIWTEGGKATLKYLFARMAFPLAEVQQPFCNMKRELKYNFPEMLKKYANEYELDDEIQKEPMKDKMRGGWGGVCFCHCHCQKQHGQFQSISAADMVYAMTAVLESDFAVHADSGIDRTDASNALTVIRPPVSSLEHAKKDGEVENEVSQKHDESNSGDIDDTDKSLSKDTDIATQTNTVFIQNFWKAYDLVKIEHFSDLQKAIEIAKNRQKQIVDMVRLIFSFFNTLNNSIFFSPFVLPVKKIK